MDHSAFSLRERLQILSSTSSFHLNVISVPVLGFQIMGIPTHGKLEEWPSFAMHAIQ